MKSGTGKDCCAWRFTADNTLNIPAWVSRNFILRPDGFLEHEFTETVVHPGQWIITDPEEPRMTILNHDEFQNIFVELPPKITGT